MEKQGEPITRKANNMNFIEYIHNYSYKELQELKMEVVSLLLLDKEKCAANKSIRDVVEDIDDVLKRLNQQGDRHSIIAGVVQLVKVESLKLSHLQSASFYKDWLSNGYIAQIERNIKLPY